jgi:hypothetical protein
LIHNLCQDCRHFNHIEQPLTGECRRKPPTVHIYPITLDDGTNQMGSFSAWPETQSDDWCGKFKASDEGI